MMTSIEVLSSRQETIDGMRNEVNGDYVHDTASGMRSMGIMTNSKRKEG
jgi:hypothetical protein